MSDDTTRPAAMTPEDADRLYEQVKQLSTKELRLLWRWLFMEWASRKDHTA